LFGLAAGLAVLGFGVPALAQDPAAGRALAERWCSACHAVTPGAVGSDVVPSFERIANDQVLTEEWLTARLAVPHHSMPSLSLTRRQIADLVAYVNSLRGGE
jgi:mono/diheme cytochrome c family protein